VSSVLSNSSPRCAAGFGISGTIPDGFQYFPALKSLKLDYNEFVGTMPSFLGRGGQGDVLLENLTVLSANFNQLSGTIPFSIYFLRSLQRLNLGMNQFSGTIAPEISNLGNLTTYVS